MRELPETIRRLKGRLENFSADQATAAARARDPITVGDRSDDAPAALGRRLDALPEKVTETKRFPLGRTRGLAFGLVLHPGGAADVYLEGAATRCFPATIAAREQCSGSHNHRNRNVR